MLNATPPGKPTHFVLLGQLSPKDPSAGHEGGFARVPMPSLGADARHFCVGVAPKPEAIGIVRRYLDKVLRQWGVGGASFEARLLGSELATNAVKYAPGPDIELRAVYGSGRLLVAVDDASQTPPKLATRKGAERGCGLAVVLAYTQHRGWTPLPWGGKRVWGELAVRQAMLNPAR